jgi:hypothetical protein
MVERFGRMDCVAIKGGEADFCEQEGVSLVFTCGKHFRVHGP